MSHIPPVAPQPFSPLNILLIKRNILVQAIRTPKLLLVTSLALGIIVTLAYFLFSQLKNRSTRPQPLNGTPPSKPSISAIARPSIGISAISRADFEARIIKEYGELETQYPVENHPSVEEGFSSAALLPENQPFNVYPNIIPYEDNRVKAVPFYFNASWIYRQIPPLLSRAIASQGPTQNQHARFWHMALRTSKVIVTLSLPKDDSIYWPEKLNQPLRLEEKGVSPITVVKFSEESVNGIIKRQFAVATAVGFSKTIIQLQIPDWPEHTGAYINTGGVISKERLATALETLDKLLDEMNSNFIVHCVAGTGRTGTFLAAFEAFTRLKYGSQQLSKDLTKDLIWNVAVEGRSKELGRNGFIRSYDQYLLIYDTLMKMFPALTYEDVSRPKRPAAK